MRELLNLLDNVLTESSGLVARKPGDPFKRKEPMNDGNDDISFVARHFYPEQGGTLEPEQFAPVVKRLQSAGVKFVNKKMPNKGGILVIEFVNDSGQRLYWAKVFGAINPIFDKNSFHGKEIPGNYTLQTAIASKEHVGYKPSQVLETFANQTPDSVLGQITKRFGNSSPLTTAAKVIADAGQFPVNVTGAGQIDFTGFRDYFCEMLQPIVLIHGAAVEGNAGDAATRFLGPNGFNDCVMTFNETSGGELADCILTNPEGKSIQLSSKGAKGADASAVNLLMEARKLQEVGLGEFIDNHPEVMEILEEIEKGGHNSTPLNFGVRYGLITQIESELIMEHLPKLSTFDPNSAKWMTANLRKIYKERTAEGEIIPLNHIIASIAYQVSDYINLNTDFGEACSEILNNGALVQMYTRAKQTGDTISVNFKTIWPGKAVTNVTLQPEKAYNSKRSSKGKYVFRINEKAKAIPNKDEATTAVPAMPPTTPKAHDASMSADKITRPGRQAEPRGEPAAGLGRKRR